MLVRNKALEAALFQDLGNSKHPDGQISSDALMAGRSGCDESHEKLKLVLVVSISRTSIFAAGWDRIEPEMA